MEKQFVRFANATAQVAGRPWVFGGCLLIVLVWALSGPLFGFNETWQLVINTGTTIITFLMVFLIQNTQNRDGAAMQAKLDELIHAVRAADERFIGIENLTDGELREILGKVEERAARLHGAVGKPVIQTRAEDTASGRSDSGKARKPAARKAAPRRKAS